MAGLTLGGPDFRLSRDEVLFQTPGVDPLRLTVINVGRGKRFLLTGSQESLRELLKNAPGGARVASAKIVNLSVAYDGPQALGVFDGIFAESLDTLFVVAAGNKQTDVSAGQIFPAGLGNRENVMTVAAHDVRNPAELSWFSNFGPYAVDVAAPGCGVKSWLNMVATGEISGTSQATPIAVFETALLKTLDNSLSPVQLKGRAMASGDMLGGGAQRWRVVSGSKLNIPQALLMFDDVIEVLPPLATRQPGDIAETWIGDVTEFWGFRCASDDEAYATGRSARTLWGVKAQGDEIFLFINRDVHRFDHCSIATTPPAEGAPAPFVRFVRRARLIDSKIVEDTTPQAAQDIGLDQLQKLVLKGPYNGYP